MPVNMDYDGWQYDYVYAANIQPVAYRPGEYLGRTFPFELLGSTQTIQKWKKSLFPKRE